MFLPKDKRALTQPCLPLTGTDPAWLALGGRAVSGKPQEEAALSLCSQQPQGRRAAGGKGQWQRLLCSLSQRDTLDSYLLSGRKEGGVLHITAPESGIFKRTCRNEMSVQTKDHVQLKSKGTCRSRLESLTQVFFLYSSLHVRAHPGHTHLCSARQTLINDLPSAFPLLRTRLGTKAARSALGPIFLHNPRESLFPSPL